MKKKKYFLLPALCLVAILVILPVYVHNKDIESKSEMETALNQWMVNLESEYGELGENTSYGAIYRSLFDIDENTEDYLPIIRSYFGISEPKESLAGTTRKLLVAKKLNNRKKISRELSRLAGSDYSIEKAYYTEYLTEGTEERLDKFLVVSHNGHWYVYPDCGPIADLTK